MIRAKSEWVVRKRDGRTAPYDGGLIGRAIANAFRAELNLADGQPLDSKTDQEIREIAQEVEDAMVAFLQTQERYRFLDKSVQATEESLKLLIQI